MAEQKIKECSKLMADLGFTIAFAESATAGWLCSKFALTDESGKVLKGGITCYDANLKVTLLGVPKELIEQHSPESMEVTREMAYRLVGTMVVFGLINGGEVSFRKVFEGSCEEIIHQTISSAADLLIYELKLKKYESKKC